MIIFLILGLLLGGVTVIFALQNVATITVVFLAWQIEGSLALIIILAVAMGVLLSLLLSVPSAIEKHLKISNLKTHNEMLKEELINKDIEVEEERSKLDANNAYIDDLEQNPKV